MTKFALLIVALMIAIPESASAQLLLDQALGGAVGGGNELGLAARGPVDAATILQSLKQQGYSNINVSPTNSQQYTALNPLGMAVLLTVEPVTGKILSVTPQ